MSRSVASASYAESRPWMIGLTKDRSMSNPVDRGTLLQGRVTVCGSMVKVSLHEHGRRCEHRTLQDTDSMRSDAGPVHDEVTEDDDMDFVAAPAWALARHVQVALPPFRVAAMAFKTGEVPD